MHTPLNRLRRSVPPLSEVVHRLLKCLFLCAMFLASPPAFGCESSKDSNFQLCVDAYSETYLRLPQVDRTLFNAQTKTFFTKHADGVMSQRNRAPDQRGLDARKTQRGHRLASDLSS